MKTPQKGATSTTSSTPTTTPEKQPTPNLPLPSNPVAFYTCQKEAQVLVEYARLAPPSNNNRRLIPPRPELVRSLLVENKMLRLQAENTCLHHRLQQFHNNYEFAKKAQLDTAELNQKLIDVALKLEAEKATLTERNTKHLLDLATSETRNKELEARIRQIEEQLKNARPPTPTQITLFNAAHARHMQDPSLRGDNLRNTLFHPKNGPCPQRVTAALVCHELYTKSTERDNWSALSPAQQNQWREHATKVAREQKYQVAKGWIEVVDGRQGPKRKLAVIALHNEVEPKKPCTSRPTTN